MNTGPKGVIADFRTYADDSANRNGGDAAGVGGAGENKKSKRKTGPKGVIEDWRNYTDRSVSSSSSSSSRPAGNGKKGKSFIGKRSESEDESGGVDDEEGIGAGENDSDREAREAYRRKRLAELSLVHRHRVNSLTVGGVVGDDDSVGKVVGVGSKGRRGGKKRVFGHLREIGAAQFTNAVEGEDGDIAVVVHIYEPVSRRRYKSPCFQDILTHVKIPPVAANMLEIEPPPLKPSPSPPFDEIPPRHRDRDRFRGWDGGRRPAHGLGLQERRVGG